MPKQLYEEALADVKKIKEVAEANAQRAVLDAVVPRIRDLIERELLNEHGDEELTDRLGVALAPGGQPMDDLVVAPPMTGPESTMPADAISPPDAEGKVTLDIDSLCNDPAGAAVAPPMMGEPVPVVADEYEISLESIAALSPVINATKGGAAKEFELRVYRLGEAVEAFKKAGRLVKETKSFSTKIAQMISRVEDMYDYVQESVTDPAKKSSYETKLETYFKELNKLQEQTKMSKQTKKMMNEEDVTLKLTGLPDDIDLDSVGVDLITGEDGEEGDDALGGDEGGEEGGDDMDLGDLDLGGGDEEGSEQDMGESRRLSDDTIVEIDENMLRREIARMRKLREESVPSVDGNGVGSKEFDDFGGASDEGAALDQDIADLSPAKAARPLGEADEDLDEQDQLDEDDDDQMDEQDQVDESDDQVDEADMPMDELDQGGYMDEQDLDQLGNKRKGEEYGAPVADSHETPRQEMPYMESKRRLAFEKRIQERAKARAAALKTEAKKAHAKKNARKVAALKEEYVQVAKRFNESVDRVKKISKRLAEAKAKSGSRQNGSPTRSAGSTTEKALRNKLAETNLINAKLVYANKLLQNESLSTRQKAGVIEQLDSAKTVREAKLVYESLSRTLAGTSKSVNENRDRRVIGSSSRATRPASTQSLNEGFEAERWARLAGLNK